VSDSNEVRGRSVHDIPLGLRARVSKTVSESDIYLFAGISGDFDQNHVDEEFCKRTSFGHRIAHGALVLGYTSAASTRILHAFERPMVSLGYDRVRFLKPVYIGDTLTVEYEIVDRQPEKERVLSKIEVTNQRGELVLVATHVMQLVD
jgi:acyl dehydratase